MKIKSMTRKQKSDPLLAEIKRGLMPGRFVRYDDMFDFTGNLDEVEAKIASLVDNGEAERAVALYELFLAGCYDKMEECDDSGANLSMFWTELFCGWIQARQAAELPASETVEQILRWMENDDYGFCYRIERDVVKALNREGYRLFVRHFEETVNRGIAVLPEPRPDVIFEYDNSIRLPALSLKDIYHARRDAKSYAGLCERLGFSPRDCERLVEIEIARKRWDKALMWLEKGLALEPERDWRNERALSLEHSKPEILQKLGRSRESLAMAWADFEEHACGYAYDRLMQYVPRGKKKEWHGRAMATAERGDLGDFMDICVKTKEWSRLASRIQATPHPKLEGLSHYHLEPAAAEDRGPILRRLQKITGICPFALKNKRSAFCFRQNL